MKPGHKRPTFRKFPTSLVRCDPGRTLGACGLLQAEYTVPPAVLYTTYWYRSGTNVTMQKHLLEIVAQAWGLTGLKYAARVLDIGCNDGTLLGYYPAGFTKFGVDPCDIAGEIKPPVNVVRDFFPSARLTELAGGQPFDIITSIAMFYDLEDPVAFAREVKNQLARTGAWILEVSYMPAMLKNTGYDTICHEHVEYYSFGVIENILGRVGMKAIDVSLDDTNGGSLRCVATHAENFFYGQPGQSVHQLRQDEVALGLATGVPYQAFRRRVHAHRKELRRLLEAIKNNGRTVHVYGASTKGNTLLQFCGIDHSLVDVAADRNPAKWGARTLGTNILIVSEEESRALKPDYYLVLPWHFKKEFLERERKTLRGGVSFIFPLPEIEIVHG